MSEKHHQNVLLEHLRAKPERARNVTKKNQQKNNASSKRPKAGDLESRSLSRGAISIFILFHLVAITCWAIPLDFAVLRGVRELVAPYMRWAGLFQSWDTFSPNPKPDNSYIKAVVITQNHHMHVWAFPRMEQLSFGERYRKEKYRKFTEVLPEQKNAALWPDIAKHLAWQFKSQTDPPDKVLLIQFQTDIKPGIDEADAPSPKPNIFYEDYVQPENFK